MKYKSLPFLALTALLAFSVATPAPAAPRRSTKPKTPEVHATVISAVTPTSLTIQEDKVTKSFTITPFTEINVNGQRATLADLKPGMAVTVTLGTDQSKLSRIDAGPSPVAPAAAR